MRQKSWKKDGLIEGDFWGPEEWVRGRWKIGLKVDGLCTSRRLTQYLPTGVSTVRIRLKTIFSTVGVVVLETGAKPFRRNCAVQWKWRELPLPGLPRNQKEKKTKVVARYNTLFFENWKSNKF